MKTANYTINELAQLQDVAKQMKLQVQAGQVVYMIGDLGAGKTTFAKMFLKACGVTEHVKSPTYTLYETYQVAEQVFVHMDLYRLTDPEELYFMGIEDLINDSNIILVEWPEKGAGVMPEPDWSMAFSFEKLNRTLTITSKQ